jgi:hypothetical protein
MYTVLSKIDKRSTFGCKNANDTNFVKNRAIKTYREIARSLKS